MPAFTSIALGIGAAATATSTLAGLGVFGDGGAGEERDMIRSRAREAARKSPTEIAAMNSMLRQKEQILATNEANIKRLTASLDTIDPIVKEAGTQVYDLLKGKEAAALAPVIQLRDRQRIKLENELARKLGSGWRTTSAGLEAMTKFDEQTFQAVNVAQTQALNQLAGLTSGGAQLQSGLASTIDGLRRSGVAVDQAILAAEGGIKNREVAAVTGAQQAINQMQPSMVQQLAGAGFGMGTNLMGQAMGSMMFKDLMTGAPAATKQPVAGAAPAAAAGDAITGLVDTNTYGGQLDLNARANAYV